MTSTKCEVLNDQNTPIFTLIIGTLKTIMYIDEFS